MTIDLYRPRYTYIELLFVSLSLSFFFTTLLILLLRWLNPFFRIANQHTLEEQDMYEVLVEDKSEVLGQAMQR